MINLYWNQYISIEKEFAETVNYVALAEDNYRTYSDAYIKIMLQLGSEVDIALKLYCQILDKQFYIKTLINIETSSKNIGQNFVTKLFKSHRIILRYNPGIIGINCQVLSIHIGGKHITK